MSADETPVIPPLAVIPGRYDGPALIADTSANYEVMLQTRGGAIGADPVFYNAFDFLEVALAAAWAVSPEQTTKVLSQTRLRGFEVPPHLSGGAA